MPFLTKKQQGNVIIIPSRTASKPRLFLTRHAVKAVPPVSLPGRAQEEAGILHPSRLPI